MSPSRKGIILGILQLVLVASLGAKYAIDRARFPRVWAQTVAYDPDSPIRGRYLSVRVRVDVGRVYGSVEPPKGNAVNFWSDQRDVYLHAEGGRLVADPAPVLTGLRVTRWRTRTGELAAALSEPVDFFLPRARYRSLAAATGRRIMGGGDRSSKGPAAADPAGGEARRRVHATRNQMKCGPGLRWNVRTDPRFTAGFLLPQACESRRIMDQSTK